MGFLGLVGTCVVGTELYEAFGLRVLGSRDLGVLRIYGFKGFKGLGGFRI